jgi:hypothetical protein
MKPSWNRSICFLACWSLEKWNSFFLSTLCDLFRSHSHTDNSGRIYAMQWSEYLVIGCRDVYCLHVLKTTVMESGQSRSPSSSLCYMEIVDRNCIQNEYKQ